MLVKYISSLGLQKEWRGIARLSWAGGMRMRWSSLGSCSLALSLFAADEKPWLESKIRPGLRDPGSVPAARSGYSLSPAPTKSPDIRLRVRGWN